MNRLRQLLTIAEMQGRDLLRRRGALLMLAAMPLAFYFALLGKGGYAITTGGVGMAFSVSGAALFSMLAAKRIEPRLVLAGYRPLDLLLGRLLLLEALGLVIVLLTTALMTVVSRPPHPGFVLAGIAGARSTGFGRGVCRRVPPPSAGAPDPREHFRAARLTAVCAASTDRRDSG